MVALASTVLAAVSIMTVLVLWEGRGIGAIGVARSTGPFKPKELAMLQTFGDQAVIAIQNARMFEQVQERTRELSASLEDLRTRRRDRARSLNQS